VTSERLSVASRVLAAGLGGYFLANAAAALGSAVLPGTRVEAVTWMTTAAFLAHLIAILWAFAARSALRAWIGIGGPALACMVAVLVIGRA